jgi:O-acetyl-ADP-ribose deacetylase (regulator of RNase III)
MPFTIIRNDITKLHVDAIVNSANKSLLYGSGVCGQIFKAAGKLELQAACDKLAPIKTGEAVITPGFALPAKYIIHAAGPVYRDGKRGEEELLRAAYTNALKRAVENECESIAFPLISSGIYGYPKAEALRVATFAIRDFLCEHDIDVSLVVFDREAFEVSEKLLGAVASYIDEHYVEAHRVLQGQRYSIAVNLDDLIDNIDEPFSTTLLRLIDAKGKADSEVYKRANIDRKLFSKIRSGNGYMPSKRTAVALAVALELNLNETGDLLGRAGYTLSHSQKFDVIIEYFIASGKYDVYEINEVLFNYDQQLLGG